MINLTSDRERFGADHELLFRADAIAPAMLAELQREAACLERSAVRVHVPLVRSGGTVGARQLRREAPTMTAIYHQLADAVSALVGRPLHPKDDDDDHGFALYSYRAGDFMRFHHDMCGCKEGNSYSVTVGIVDDSSARLECRLPDGREIAIATSPGSLVVYNGSRIYHRVSKLGAGQRRVVLSGSYRTQAARDPIRHLAQRVTDGLLYYGVRRRR